MSLSDDEFIGYNYSDYTEEDWAEVDVLSSHGRPFDRNHQYKGGPAIPIEVEKPTMDSHQSSVLASPACQRVNPQAGTIIASPYQKYRSWRRVLSVSDLISPAWCAIYIMSVR
jgi:exonuclease V